YVLRLQSRKRHETGRNPGRRPYSDGCNLVLVTIADDRRNPRQLSNFLRRPLCVTASHNDAAARIFSQDTANVRTGVTVGLGGNGACIYYYDVGVFDAIGRK